MTGWQIAGTICFVAVAFLAGFSVNKYAAYRTKQLELSAENIKKNCEYNFLNKAIETASGFSTVFKPLIDGMSKRDTLEIGEKVYSKSTRLLSKKDLESIHDACKQGDTDEKPDHFSSGTRFLRRFRPLAPHGGRIPLVPDVRGREIVPVHSCPYCGCPDVYLADTDGGGRTVACPSCGMSGPESVDGDDEEAARGWDILCRKMCRHCNRHLVKILKELKK